MRREQVDHPIEVLDLSVRAYNSLKRAGINWASQVLSLTDDELLDIQGIGISTLGGIKIRLERYRKAMLVRPVQQQSTPPLTQADPAQVEPSPGDVSIDVLDLSARAHNCLIRSQVRTISQLAVLTDEQLLDIRNLGVGCLAEIRQKIEAYLQKHPEGRKLPTVSSEEQRPPPAPRYRPPLVPVELRARAAKLPLEDISVARLLLPSKDADFLSRCEISSVAMLMEQPADAFVPGSPVPERVNRYLQWLVRQDEKTWREEVAGQRISPMHSLLLEGETLDDLTTRWLEAIGERERRVLEGRFAGRTLEEIGQELGLTRERIRQLETRAIKRLKGVRLQLSVASLDALLAQALTDAGGLMTADEAREVLVETVTIGTADVAWSTWLLLNTSGQLQELSAEQLWGLASRPLHLVPVIRHCLTELHAAGVRPTSGDELLSHLTATELLEPLKGELDAAFVAACYRTMRLPSIPAQVPMPEQRLKLPTRQDVPPERGEPKGLSFKLYEWEQRLRPLVGQVELLGEIPLTAEETTDLAKAVDARLRKTKLSEVVSIFRRQYPCSLAVFLVAQGVYGYSGVDGYWPNVSRALGRNLHPGWTGQLGLLFETVLTDLGLPLFPDLGGHRFVTLILLHGGIPDYCLDDFFANMLQPGVTRARYAGMSAAELIEEWRWRASGRHVTDKPVLYFLEFGGLVAQDFCERCLEMARETAESGIVPEAAEVGLPPRVVSAYSRWIAEQDIAQVRREAGDRWGLRKPEVRADPWGEGILLELPPQQVPVMAIQADIAWQIQVGETMLSVPVRVRRSGFDWKTVPES
ncbi:MAG: sigma-70 family RNA polymerase sigma factor, partial [Anaerolineae bacterium]|nr:sigma-70 family RNA polymerase sigma factor [Anaerolineae bacterium]